MLSTENHLQGKDDTDRQFARTLRRTCCVGALLVACSLLGCGDKQSSTGDSKKNTEVKPLDQGTAKKDVPIESTEPVLTVSATTLAKDYKTDSTAADKKYKGKWIAVEGMSQGTEVQKPLEGFSKHEATLILSGGEPPAGDDARVRCECLMTETDNAIRISAGQKLKVIGKCTGSDSPPIVGIEGARIAERGTDPAIVTTVEAFVGDYIKDEKSADAKYKNKIVTITGTGGELKNNLGLICVVFPGMKDKSGIAVPISCYFLPDWKYRLEKIKSTGTITIKGNCSGRGSLSEGIVLGSCSLMP